MAYDEYNDTVDFTFVVPDQTWMGVVLGGRRMFNVNMIAVVADGENSYFNDLYSIGEF